MRRLFDIVFSLVVLILLVPLMVLIAMWIKLSSKGPVVYSQNRVGKEGRIFQIHKFRTMVNDADRMGTSITTVDDQRITPLGRFLRKTKLDELPQFWNVLKGEMSLVGPRPDVPEVVDTYTQEMRRILDIKPGITSIASLYLRREEELLAKVKDPEKAYLNIVVPAKVDLAMIHVDKRSFLFDLSFLIKTVWIMIFHRSDSKSEKAFIASLFNRLEKEIGIGSTKPANSHINTISAEKP